MMRVLGMVAVWMALSLSACSSTSPVRQTADRNPPSSSPRTAAAAPVVNLDALDAPACQRQWFSQVVSTLPQVRNWKVSQTQDRHLTVAMSSDPMFDRGSAQLKPNSLLPLQRLAQALAMCARVSTYVMVYDDNAEGTSLAERRAATATDYLVREGLSKDSIQSLGRGGSSKSDDASVRRLELQIKPRA